jgi:hypothetical protein
MYVIETIKKIYNRERESLIISKIIFGNIRYFEVSFA